MGAQQQTAPSGLLPPADTPMTLSEFQGLSCASLGVVAGLIGIVYLRPIEEATHLGAAMLAAPLVATGFAVGCSVGATLAPALLWAYRHFAS